MALKPLSRIVHGFMAKWLLLPALIGLICGSAIWIGIEAGKIQKEQTYYARTVAQHVNSYLQHSQRQLKQFAAVYRENGSNRDLLPFLPEHNPSILTVHLLDSSGKIVGPGPQEGTRTDFAGTIQSASLQKEFRLTPPYYSLSQDEIVVGMVVAASGDRLLLAELDLAAIQESIQELTRHMHGGYAFLTDSYGNLLAHPDMSKVEQQVNLGSLDIISHLPSGEAKSGFYSRNGELRLMSATSVPVSDWKVGLSQNAFSLFRQDLWTIALSLAGLLALFAVTALLFDRRLQRMIVHPLTRFTHDLDALEHGEPPVEDSKTHLSASEDCSELWSLQKNFQTMQRTVRQREATLREREEALRQSENFYRAIFETSGAAMLIIEEDTTISHVNSNFEYLTGYSREEVEWKKTWKDFLHPDDISWMKNYHDARRKDPNAAPRQYEFRFMIRSGEWRNVFYTVDIIPGTTKSIGSGIDITQRKQMEEKLKEMSFHDSLTGLYNRNFFEEEMARLDDGRHNPVGLVVCDLDGLKFANDTLGHEAGDHMLINTANTLRRHFRSSDIIARIGGDEFAILLTEINSTTLEQIMQRLRQAVQEHNTTESEIPLSLSVGHALGEGETTDMHALFREADNRMYREKIQREGSARSAILQALTGSMQARDFNTQGHCDRLQELAALLARSLDLPHDSVNDLSLLARFHDLGKVGIPDHILFKPGNLTDEEWRQMRQHCEIGHRIASSVPDLEPIAEFILKHHERWDGQGYPLGLSGRNIPLPCRILAIADAYDAMTSDRPYRGAMTSEEALAELRRCAGTQFDPELVDRFIRALHETGTG